MNRLSVFPVLVIILGVSLVACKAKGDGAKNSTGATGQNAEKERSPDGRRPVERSPEGRPPSEPAPTLEPSQAAKMAYEMALVQNQALEAASGFVPDCARGAQAALRMLDQPYQKGLLVNARKYRVALHNARAALLEEPERGGKFAAYLQRYDQRHKRLRVACGADKAFGEVMAKLSGAQIDTTGLNLNRPYKKRHGDRGR